MVQLNVVRSILLGRLRKVTRSYCSSYDGPTESNPQKPIKAAGLASGSELPEQEELPQWELLKVGSLRGRSGGGSAMGAVVAPPELGKSTG